MAAVPATSVAARNNAEWCHVFCRTHGIVGHFEADAWWSAQRTPPFYPDAVTLASDGDARRILAKVDARAGWPGLLADDSIAILARYDSGRVAAGAIANRSSAAVGLSNVFDDGDDLESAYLGAAATAQERLGPVPVVGYDSGVACEAAQRAGFVRIGKLTVWVRDGGSSTA